MSVGGALLRRTMASIVPGHRVLLVVEPAPRRAGVKARLVGALRDMVRRVKGVRTEPARLAAGQSIPYYRASGRRDAGLARRLRRLAPDIICIAGYPWLLPREVFSIPRLGAINLHPSLLPRHRGLMPEYWVYASDDRETGVTVHWVAQGADTGDIIAQQRIPLARGEGIVSLHERCAEAGAALMASALDAIENGTATRTPQDEHLATLDPPVRPGCSIVRVNEWDVERVWHVLSGLFPMYREPLTGPDKAPIRYRGVLGFDRIEHARPNGATAVTPDGWLLYCRGGVVRLAREKIGA